MAGELRDRINVSLQAVAQVLVVCGLGVYLARKHGLDRNAIAAVSGVNWHVLIPALMFSSIVGAVTPSNLALLWPMLLVSLLHIVLGVVPAFLLGWVAKLPRDMWFFAVMASSLPNCGNLPWLFMPSIIKYYAPPAEAAAQTQYMVGLVSVYTIITILVTLTVPFIFKRPPDSLLLPRRRQQQQQGEAARQQQGQLQDAGSVQLELAETGTAVAAADSAKQVRKLHHLAADGTAAAAAAVAGDTASHQDSYVKCAQPHGAPRAASHCQQPTSNSYHQQQGCEQQHHASAATAAAAGLLPVASHSTLADSCSPFELAEVDEDHDAALNVPPAAAYRLQQQAQLQAADSFASHRSSSRLLQHGQSFFGSFSRSFGRSFSRGLRRSESMVKLVWTFPMGWQRDRTAAAAAAAAAGQQLEHHHQQQQGDAGPGWQQKLPRWLAVPLRCCRAVLDHPAVNVPLGATVLGIACAAAGLVRGLLVDELAPLHWLWLSLSWVGAAAAPLATLQIGAELMQAAPVELGMRVTRRAQWLATAIAIVVKLLLVPLINVALIRAAGMHRLVPAEDEVYQLLLLVEAAVPAAVTLLVVCGRVYPDIRPLSQMLFWQYVASLVTLPAFLVWFMYMLDL